MVKSINAGMRVRGDLPGCLFSKRWVRVFLIVSGLSLSAQVGNGQSIRVQSLSDDGTRALLEFQMDWKRPLQAAIDSSGIAVWDAGLFDLFAAGFDEVSETIRLGSLRMPIVTVVDREFDEVAVPVSDGPPALKTGFREPEVVGLGMYRKHPTVTVSVPVFELDSGSGLMRRYRRIRVSVTRNTPVQAVSARLSNSSNPHVLLDHSVLADGTIFKIQVTEEGVYRIDRSLLESLGLSPDSIEPAQLQIYGNGGQPLPAKNNAFRYADLTENPVWVRGGGDGRFDSGDVLLFYARGPTGWTFEEGIWTHYVHPFSNENAYFLKVGGDPGLRITGSPFPGDPGATLFTSTTGRHVLDIEEQVWSREHGSGHDWMSQTIRSGGSRDIISGLMLPGLLSGTVEYSTRIAIASNPRATVAFVSDDVVLAQPRAPGRVIEGAEFRSAWPVETTFSQSVSAGQALNLTMRLISQPGEPQAALDWIRIMYDRDLVDMDGYLRFATMPGASGYQTYQLRALSADHFVWDVTTPGTYTSLGVNSAPAIPEIQIFSQPGDAPREIVAFQESAARGLTSDSITPVQNQDLHGITSFPDLIIVTPTEFLDAAQRLAEHRRADGLVVEVSILDKIYNEFSGGIPDMRAIRDYFKFLYDRAPDDESLLKYALLVGDGHYDFRGLSSLEQQLGNWIFPYETEESLLPDASFTSDDYFGLLSDDEGEWKYTTFTAESRERVDIGIGRFPVQSASQADMLVDKIIRYEDPSTFGPWRSNYLVVADDGPTGLDGSQNDADLHLLNVDQVAELIRGSLYRQINVDKVYAESFERVFLSDWRIPDARAAINAALNSGTLVFNYSGHGGPNGLAQEAIFTKEDAGDLTNEDQLAIFVTATCSFGWWDLENTQSGAETLLLNERGGAIALLTTVRLVYTSPSTTSLNAGLNRALNLELFQRDEEGKPRRLGDALRTTKNTRVGLQGNSRKFNLLGDPSMRIGVATGTVEVQTLNEVPIEQEIGQLKALDRATISGVIHSPDGSINTGFNGTVAVTVFDAERRVPLVEQRFMPQPYYTIREDLIWRGDVEVLDGRFSATFVVPKDISYSNERGRIFAYALSSGADAAGYSENFLVGGTSSNPPNDQDGPELALFLNDSTFVAGSVVPAEPELIVKLFDESGINTVGAGVGHEMLLIIDGNESAAVDISSGFVADRNSYQRGESTWQLSVDEPGVHTLSVRAWDVLNNSNTAEIPFSIANDEVFTVRNVYNYPNPMNRETRFVFEHNQPSGTPARVQIRVYTLNGRPIRTIDTEEALPEGILTGGSVQIPWDGRDDDFDQLTTGIYLYKLRVEVEQSDGTRQVSERIEKLAVIR